MKHSSLNTPIYRIENCLELNRQSRTTHFYIFRDRRERMLRSYVCVGQLKMLTDIGLTFIAHENQKKVLTGILCLQKVWHTLLTQCFINPLNPELNPICYLLALLGAHHFLHVSRIRVKLLTFRRLMSYIYMEHPFLMFLDHTQRCSTVGRTALDE